MNCLSIGINSIASRWNLIGGSFTPLLWKKEIDKE
jgi:hypothetical protein